MIPHVVDEAAVDVGRVLLVASIEAAAVLSFLYVVTRLVRRAPPAARSAVWWLGSFKVLVACAGLTPFVLPVLPSPERAVSAIVPGPQAELARASLPAASASQIVMVSATSPASLPAPAPGPTRTLAPVVSSRDALAGTLLLALVVWFAGVVFGLGRWATQLVRARRFIADAVPADDPALLDTLAEVSRRAGLRTPPALYLSPDATAPFATGVLKPAVVLPWDACERLDDPALRMTLAHEVAHVRRGDLWLGWVPAAARTLFWFHPAVRLAAREYLQAREEACDADAVRLTGGAPDAYGALLLSFGVLRADAAAAGAHGASPAFIHLRRRLEMLQHAQVRPSRRQVMSGVLVAALAVALVPFSIGAAQHAAAPLVPRVASGVIWPEPNPPPVAPVAGPPFEWTEADLLGTSRRAQGPKQKPTRQGPTAGSMDLPLAVGLDEDMGGGPAVAEPSPGEPASAHSDRDVEHHARGEDEHSKCNDDDDDREHPVFAVHPDPAVPVPPVLPEPEALAAVPDVPGAPHPVHPPELAEFPQPPHPVVVPEPYRSEDESDETALPRRLTARLAELGAHLDAKTQRTIEKLIQKQQRVAHRLATLTFEKQALARARQALDAQQQEAATHLQEVAQAISSFDRESACEDELRHLEAQFRSAERQLEAIERAREAIEREDERFEARLEAATERQQELEEELEASLEAAIEHALERANLHGG